MTESTHQQCTESPLFNPVTWLTDTYNPAATLIIPGHSSVSLLCPAVNMIWLCITSLLSITPAICNQLIDTSHIRVFPAVNKSIAGVFQVSDLNQPHYAFNASEARRLCSALGVNIASKAQVQEALTSGLETCRYGWIDEHFAVIPRIKHLSICGQNKTGLVTWRASVTKKFDVFCFNESDAATQLKDATTDSPMSSTHASGQSRSSSKAANSTQAVHPPSSSSSLLSSSSSTPHTADSGAAAARFVSSARGSAGAKPILITSTCALLLIAIIVLVFIKMRRSRSDLKQKQEYVQTEEWTCVKDIKETDTAAQEEERIEMDDNAS